MVLAKARTLVLGFAHCRNGGVAAGSPFRLLDS